MHEYQFDSRRRKTVSSKHQISLSRREVSFEPEKKKKKTKKNPHSQSSSSRSSSVSILTSSRPSSGPKEAPGSGSGYENTSKRFRTIEPTRFYENPKSLLEKQYERSLQRFVPVELSDDFSPLESDSVEIESDVKIESSLLRSASSEEQETDVRPEISVSDLLSDASLEKEFHVTYYINASEELLKKAHSLVLGANDIAGTQVYYSLVKMALKALHIVIADYRAYLNPVLESVVYHKLGTIYLRETQEWETAEHYVNLAISLAEKHNLTRITISSEFLYCQVLEIINPKALSAFLLEKHHFYKKQGYAHIADILMVIRANHLPATDGSSSTSNSSKSSLSENALPQIKSMCLLCEANSHLYRGISAEVDSSIESAITLVDNDQTAPSQLIALAHLTKLVFCVQKGDSVNGKETVDKLSHFISVQRELNWKGWRDDGFFEISVPLHDGEQDIANFDFRWVNSDEFVILFYFLSAMVDIVDPSHNGKTKKIFGFCLEAINMQLEQLTNAHASNHNFHISYLTDKIVRLNFIRYSVIYYKIWLAILHESDYSGMSSVKYFIDNFDEDSFTKEEMCFYKLLVPKFLYLAATYYQAHGDLNAAKYNYQRVRKAFSEVPTDQSSGSSSLQKSLGVGCQMLIPRLENNELYVFSTLHLAVIANHDLAVMTEVKSSESTFRAKYLTYHSLLSDLMADLNDTFDGSGKNVTWLSGHSLVQQVHQLVRFACLTRELKSTKSARLSDTSSIISESVVADMQHGFVEALHSYLVYKFSTNLGQSSKMLDELVFSVSSGDKTARSLGVLLISDEEEPLSVEHARQLQEVKQSILSAKEDIEKKLELAKISAQL